MPFDCPCGNRTYTMYINGRGDKWCEKCEDKNMEKEVKNKNTQARTLARRQKQVQKKTQT